MLGLRQFKNNSKQTNETGWNCGIAYLITIWEKLSSNDFLLLLLAKSTSLKVA